MTHATIPAIVELTTNLDTVNEFFKRMVAKRVMTGEANIPIFPNAIIKEEEAEVLPLELSAASNIS